MVHGACQMVHGTWFMLADTHVTQPDCLKRNRTSSFAYLIVNTENNVLFLYLNKFKHDFGAMLSSTL